MGFEPTNSYKNGCLIRVWRLQIDLESVAVGHLATSAQSAERFHVNIAVLAEKMKNKFDESFSWILDVV